MTTIASSLQRLVESAARLAGNLERGAEGIDDSTAVGCAAVWSRRCAESHRYPRARPARKVTARGRSLRASSYGN